MELDLLEEAAAVLDQIEPVSDEEWLARVAAAALSDEPVPTYIQERYRELDEVLARRHRRAG